MFRRISIGAAALALGASAVAVVSSPAFAAPKPIITAGAGSSLHCAITGKAKISPGLKNNWVKADHASDPNASVRAIPNTTFASPPPVTTSGKFKGTCTGAAKSGTTTVHVTGVQVTLSSQPGHPGTSGTCSSLLDPNPSTARYNSAVKWKASDGKVNPTTITGSSLAAAGTGFALTGGTITGSFAGGTSTAQGNADGETLLAVLQGPPTSVHPVPAHPQCQPTIQFKKGVASLKSPKGLKKLAIVTGSTVNISR